MRHCGGQTIDDGIELLSGMRAGEVSSAGCFHALLDERLQQILAALEEQPLTGGAARVRLPTQATPKPSPPPLPGEELE